MDNIYVCSVNIQTLEADVRSAFEAYTTKPFTAIMILIIGEGRISRELVDYMVEGIKSSSVCTVALVRNDLFIQFLVSSINLRCSQTSIKAFKTDSEAHDWLSLSHLQR